MINNGDDDDNGNGVPKPPAPAPQPPAPPPSADYPMDTAGNARRSAIKAALDCRYGRISQAMYELIRDKCHAKIKQFDREELEKFRSKHGQASSGAR